MQAEIDEIETDDYPDEKAETSRQIINSFYKKEGLKKG